MGSLFRALLAAQLQSDLYAHWDFSDASTITESGGLVIGVADKGPNGFDLTGAGNITNPGGYVYAIGPVGTRMFAANADNWELFHNGSVFTMYYVIRPFVSSATGGNMPLTVGTNDGIYVEFFSSNFYIRRIAGGTTTQAFPSVPAAPPAGTFSGYIACDGVNLAWRNGGVAGAPEDSFALSGTPGTDNRAFELGSLSPFAGGVDTRYYEIRIELNYLTNQAAIDAEFNSKFGL